MQVQPALAYLSALILKYESEPQKGQLLWEVLNARAPPGSQLYKRYRAAAAAAGKLAAAAAAAAYLRMMLLKRGSPATAQKRHPAPARRRSRNSQSCNQSRMLLAAMMRVPPRVQR
jgi:hypothetical protein